MSLIYSIFVNRPFWVVILRFIPRKFTWNELINHNWTIFGAQEIKYDIWQRHAKVKNSDYFENHIFHRTLGSLPSSSFCIELRFWGLALIRLIIIGFICYTVTYNNSEQRRSNFAHTQTTQQDLLGNCLFCKCTVEKAVAATACFDVAEKSYTDLIYLVINCVILFLNGYKIPIKITCELVNVYVGLRCSAYFVIHTTSCRC